MDEHLARLRHASFLLYSGRGGVGADSNALHAATQRGPIFDPVYDVTMAPFVKYCACVFVWDGRVPLASLQRAGQQLENQRFTSKPTWHGLRGPMAAAWASLLRVGWTMRPGLALVLDTGVLVELLQTPPKEVVQLLREGSRDGGAARSSAIMSTSRRRRMPPCERVQSTGSSPRCGPCYEARGLVNFASSERATRPSGTRWATCPAPLARLPWPGPLHEGPPIL